MTIIFTRTVRIAAIALLALNVAAAATAQNLTYDREAVSREVAAALKEYHRIFFSKRADDEPAALRPQRPMMAFASVRRLGELTLSKVHVSMKCSCHGLRRVCQFMSTVNVRS